jgi:rhodanese-related sulfurtransferase
LTGQEISPQELASLLQDPAAEVMLLDVREPWEWSLVHMEGSTHIPMHLIPLRHNELPDDKLIVTICHHGVRSLQVSTFLRHAGFDRVVSMQGGIDAWANQVDTTLPRY